MAPSESIGTIEPAAKSKLELLYQVSETIGATSDMAALLEQIIEMTQKALDASAASILLFKENEQQLFFEAASGPFGEILRSIRVDTQYSIAGEVMRSGKPFIVNDVRKNRNFHGNIDKITGFVTKSLICAPLVARQKTIGVLEVLNKLDGSRFDETDVQVLVPVATTAAMAIENTRLHETILEAYKNTIITLVETIDAKDPYTRGHSQRVMELALLAGASLSLSPEEMETLEYASILHDIGKIAVDGWILNKPGKLTPSEWNIIREHPAIGGALLKKIPFLEKVSRVVHHHHERYDGTGYPDGLKGADIPIEARLISVVDAFDTMTTDRSYRAAYDTEYAINELKNNSGTQFCPVAVKAFISGYRLNAENKSLI